MRMSGHIKSVSICRMDNYSSGGIGAAILIVIGIAARLILMINHHRIKSECCGKRFSAAIDIQPTTPETKIECK
jgi:hypothetical protein